MSISSSKFKVGDKVVINGTATKGLISEVDTSFSVPMYKVVSGTSTFYFAETQLFLEIDMGTATSRCECGSEKLGHPGHSWYCPKYVKT